LQGPGHGRQPARLHRRVPRDESNVALSGLAPDTPRGSRSLREGEARAGEEGVARRAGLCGRQDRTRPHDPGQGAGSALGAQVTKGVVSLFLRISVDIPQVAVHALNCVHVQIGVITSKMAQAGPPCDTVRMEYVSRVPRAPLDGLIDDLYYLEGAS